MHRPSLSQEPQNIIVREASAFIWAVLEVAGSPSLRDAAMALHPAELTVTMPGDRLRHMLFVAVATLCDQASQHVCRAAATEPGSDGFGAIPMVRSARRLVAAVQQASPQELAQAHAYFLAPPWSGELVKRRPVLADLSFGVARFMIECAADALSDDAMTGTGS